MCIPYTHTHIPTPPHLNWVHTHISPTWRLYYFNYLARFPSITPALFFQELLTSWVCWFCRLQTHGERFWRHNILWWQHHVTRTKAEDTKVLIFVPFGKYLTDQLLTSCSRTSVSVLMFLNISYVLAVISLQIRHSALQTSCSSSFKSFPQCCAAHLSVCVFFYFS